ncbi:MAG: DUF1572 family protein [Bacteroidota bacterium]
MLNEILSDFYERDIRKLIEEVKLFKNDEDLWRVDGSVKNAGGNLVLHIIGGLNYLIGTTLAQTGYVRNRELEFTDRGVKREWLVARLEELIPMINETLAKLSDDMESDYPLIFDNAKCSNSYVLTQLLLHLNYHLGQVNYLRRIFETTQ